MLRNNSRCKMTHKSPREQFNMRRDNSTFDSTTQHAYGNWVLKRLAWLAPGNWAYQGRRKIKMVEQSLEGTPGDFYRFAYSVVEQTIVRLESLNDLSEMDGLIMRLEYLNRSLANLDSPDTDEIMLLIGEAVGSMSRDRSSSFKFDGVNFSTRVSTQRLG